MKCKPYPEWDAGRMGCGTLLTEWNYRAVGHGAEEYLRPGLAGNLLAPSVGYRRRGHPYLPRLGGIGGGTAMVDLQDRASAPPGMKASSPRRSCTAPFFPRGYCCESMEINGR